MHPTLRLRSKLLLATMILACMWTIPAHAANNPEPPPKRPAMPQECDPSNWVIDPGVDYTVCEEAMTRPRQPSSPSPENT